MTLVRNKFFILYSISCILFTSNVAFAQMFDAEGNLPSIELNMEVYESLKKSESSDKQDPKTLPLLAADNAKNTSQTEQPFKPSGFIESGVNASTLNNNYGSWVGEYVKSEINTAPDSRWNLQLLNQREFGEYGQYAVIGNTYNFNEDWYSVVSVGGASHGFFLPRYRIDAFLNHKLLDDKSLVATLGFGTSKAIIDAHKDNSIFVGATYYFPQLWILQGGIRFNQSNPGNVLSASEFIAVTEGEDKKHFITLRYGFGREAYQIIGQSNTISNFSSNQISLELRQWLSDNWGFDARGEYYHNPNYDRRGINIGAFYEF